MTTIAYDGKTIAVDSRMAIGSLIVNDESVKYHHEKNKLFFMSGATDEIDLLIKNFVANTKSETKNDAAGLMIEDGKVYYVGCEDGSLLYFACDSTGVKRSLGSGSHFALAAMDHKKSAEDAVKYAMTRDCYTGGKVHVFCAKTGKKIK